MFSLENFTCFHAQNFLNVDQTDRGYNVIIAKIGYTFDIDRYTGQAELSLSPVQPSLVFADQYSNESALSSTLAESDFVLYKPKLDLIVNAIAYAPMERPAAYFSAAVSIGNYQKSLIVSGPRYWQRESFGWSLSQASPIDYLPIRYEYAFGGSGSNIPYHRILEHTDTDGTKSAEETILYNPIGQGFYTETYLQSVMHKRTFNAHQIDDPSKPILHPSDLRLPQGLGCFAHYFASRLPLSGSADETWIKERAPMLPENFSMAYWNGAHPDLQFSHFKPNHLYEFIFTGLIPDSLAPKQTFRLQLPVETLFVQLYTTKNLVLCRDLILDTVWVDTENKRIDCTYRRAFAEEIEIQAAELRFIARNERRAQIELAQEINRQHSIGNIFIPLPPSLQDIET